jgi:hypothetical protein
MEEVLEERVAMMLTVATVLIDWWYSRKIGDI